MKITKVLASVFACLGAVLMLGTTALCLLSLDAQPKILNLPDGVVQCSETLVQALSQGDYATAEGLIYGQPDLGVPEQWDSTLEQLAWETFQESLTVSFDGDFYPSDTGYRRALTVSALDVSGAVAAVSQRAAALLSQRMEDAEDLSEIYDENNEFREDLMDQVLREALEQALAEDAQLVTSQSVLELIYRDGRWWAVPDQTLLQAISGTPG